MRALAFVALAVLGCSSTTTSHGSGADASLDPWLVDAPDLDVLDAGTCTLAALAACVAPPSEPVLFDARALGAKVVALSPPFALLDPPRVVVLPDREPPLELAPTGEEASFRAVAIARGGGARAHVLVCGDDACRVLRVEHDALARVGDALPSTTRAIALVDGVPWVAGAGVRRLDGATFRAEIADGRFHAIAEGASSEDGRVVVAAGEDGRVAVHAKGAWSALSSSTHETFVSASVSGFTIVLVTQSGAVHFGTRSGIRPCTGVPLAVASVELVPWATAPTLIGVTRDARPFRWELAGSACTGAATLGLSAVSPFCPWRADWRVIDDVVLGTTGCPRD